MHGHLELITKLGQIPGVSVAIASSAGDLVTYAAGVTNNTAPQKVTDTTVFEAASLSKPVFAYLIIKMAERGEFDLDKPLYQTVPEFGPPEMRASENYKLLTARMILSHQAGLPNEFDPKRGFPYAYVSPVGKRFDYSGAAYYFLQEIVDTIIAPKTLEDLAQEEFAKIGMTHSSFLPLTGCSLIKLEDDEVPPSLARVEKMLKSQVGLICAGERLFVAERKEDCLHLSEKTAENDTEVSQLDSMKASIKKLPNTIFSRPAEAFELPLITSIIGHRPKECAESLAVGHDDASIPNPNQRCYGVHSAGSLYTTAEDYGKFLRQCTADVFVRKEMFTPVVTTLAQKDTKAINADVSPEVLGQIAWGLGIGLQKTPKGQPIAFHWGDNQTGRNFTAINLSTNQSVVCFTNSTNGPSIFKTIAEPVVGPLTSVFQWLSRRENLNFNPTAMYKDLVTNLKRSETQNQDDASSSLENKSNL